MMLMSLLIGLYGLYAAKDCFDCDNHYWGWANIGVSALNFEHWFNGMIWA